MLGAEDGSVPGQEPRDDSRGREAGKVEGKTVTGTEKEQTEEVEGPGGRETSVRGAGKEAHVWR